MTKHKSFKSRGKGAAKVRPRRRRGDINWDSQPFGTVSDASLARKLGVDTATVFYHRTKREIPPFDRSPRVDWDRQPLGKLSDATLAKRLGVSHAVVRHRRMQRAIARYSKKIDWDAQPLGKMKDAELARRLGVGASTVAAKRLARGIPSYTRGKLRVKVDWASLPYGERSDAELARELGVSEKNVQRQRVRRGHARIRVRGLSTAARSALSRVVRKLEGALALVELVLVDAAKQLQSPPRARVVGVRRHRSQS